MLPLHQRPKIKRRCYPPNLSNILVFFSSTCGTYNFIRLSTVKPSCDAARVKLVVARSRLYSILFGKTLPLLVSYTYPSFCNPREISLQTAYHVQYVSKIARSKFLRGSFRRSLITRLYSAFAIASKCFGGVICSASKPSEALSSIFSAFSSCYQLHFSSHIDTSFTQMTF